MTGIHGLSKISLRFVRSTGGLAVKRETSTTARESWHNLPQRALGRLRSAARDFSHPSSEHVLSSRTFFRPVTSGHQAFLEEGLCFRSLHTDARSNP